MTAFTEEQVEAYLERIGAGRPREATGEALRELQVRHLVAVPFENLAIHLGEDIVLTEQALFEKIVGRRRGGFCYELNGAFAALLDTLGFQVELLSARVFLPGPHQKLGPPYDHMALRVRAADGSGPWLADVGFGKHAHHPLRYDERGDQRDPGGVFRITEASEGGDLDVLEGGAPVFRLEQRPRALGDFEATCWWQRTAPTSHFRTFLTCSRLTGDGGRITLSGDRLIDTPAQGERTESRLTEGELPGAYRDHFGIVLDRIPPIPASRPE
ncbi:N-hydroxyarylamine O-acetyltransferase [Streptomyces sp. RB5]|uniref:N-hydroxyarylamine O-acetyltransferase n=1 Tax=Streptomyces smaragdinus TaxID=2585196 RepID=A0A7K0CDS0_9ACTN|nr:arylamine N-acetyltransferase [Streptomyces smaragdinus]MQY11590.1 N-hydroxyarylamine O-acetyltransferase [Streptomyces smaragdinus]